MSLSGSYRSLLLAFLVLVAVLPGSALAQDKDEDPGGNGPKNERPTVKPRPDGEAAPDQVIVKFKEEAGPTTQSSARREEGLEKKKNLNLIGAEVDKVRGKSVEQAIRDLKSRSDVEYAEPDYIVHPTGYADEPRFGELWGLDNTGQAVDGTPAGTEDVDINAKEASAVTQGDSNLIVAVIDDGVDFSHPDLKDRAWTNPGETPDNNTDDDGNGKIDDVNGWDFFYEDDTVHDEAEDFHGTHVAGTIAASMNNEGVVGVAPNVKIMALKFIGPNGGSASDAILALQYAKSKGAKISNNSWGGGGYSQALKEAIEASGSLFVAAAGNQSNDNDANPSYPASYTSANILSVAAINNQGNLASFSNYGTTSVDVSAPGVDVLSSVPGVSEKPGAVLTSVGSSGKALTSGYGAEEIDTSADQALFMSKAFSAVGRGSQEVVLVDDDRSGAGKPDIGSTFSTAIKTATGSDPQVIDVTGTNGPTFSQLEGKTVVWATGQAFNSGSGSTTLTSTDQQTLTNFLNGGGKLVLTGMDALWRIETSSFVTNTLKLNVQSDLPTTAFSGASGTEFAGESYELNSSFAVPEFHDVLTPAAAVAVTQGSISSPITWSFHNGTSMASPHATGVAALAASDSPDLLSQPTALKQVLMDNGKPLSTTAGKTITGKMVDAKAVLSPAVTAVSPRDGATGISRTANLTATFSETMNEASLEATDPTTGNPTTFTLVRSGTNTPVSATVTYDATTKKATLNPSGRLRSRTTYIATITTAAKNSADEPIAYSKIWKFRTKR